MPNFLKLCVLLALTCELPALAVMVSPRDICGDIICQARTKCQIVNGEPTCVGVSEASCQVSGNPPHFKTFDGKTFDFQGPGTYTLAKTSGSDINLPGFSIKMNNQNRGNTNTMNPTLEITDPSQNTVIKINDNMLSKVDNQQLKNGVSISSYGGYINITTDFGLFLQWDRKTSLKITLPTIFNQKVRGMCGNCNGNSADDFETPSGTQAAGPAEFGKSWAVDVHP
ncbi:zonadhesin-like [Aquarana catesbeiana]|uniref:zonadhesin-like n=1 Tax=Aquarana catesbeiana TaxID=8400 RepID=UPI003CC96EE0